MARYRKCPRSCAQGKSCKWITKMLQQVPPLKCPYFLKNVSSFMLWKPKNLFPRLEVPADFVQAHCDKLNDMVEVKGPCKRTWFIRVTKNVVCKHRRVMLDRGWISIVNELGLKTGDHLLFVLTAFSKFKIYVFDEVGIRRRSTSTNIPGIPQLETSTRNRQKPAERPFIRPSENECPREGNTSHKQALQWEDDDIMSPQRMPSTEFGKRKLRDRDSPAPGPVVVDLISDDLQCDENSESEDTGWKLGSEVQSTEKASSIQLSQRSTESKIPSKSGPHFTKRLPASSLKHHSGLTTHLEVPATFTQRHEGLFKEHINLQGPTGRIWKVHCYTTIQQRYKRVKLRAGWMDFAEDNMLKLHDQLLFTHIREGEFLVEVVTKGLRRRGRPRLFRPDQSPIISGGDQEHEDGAQMNPVARLGTPDKATSSPFRQPDIIKDPLKNRICQLQQQLLAQRRIVQKQVEDRCISRRGRMEWALGHS